MIRNVDTRRMASGNSRKKAGPDAYKEFDASQLYCPKCKRAVSVRKRLLLVLSEGDKYEYLCTFCSESVGTKIDRKAKTSTIIR